MYIYKGLILESNGMHAFFSEKGAKMGKKGQNI